AQGYPIGRRFKSAMVGRVCDLIETHLGHQASADGRMRTDGLADADALSSKDSTLHQWAAWADKSLHPELVDATVVYQTPHTEFDVSSVPDAFKPAVGVLGLTNLENSFGITADSDIFDQREISRDVGVVLIRLDA